MTTATVRDVVRATPRTRLIRLDLGGVPFVFRAGQAIVAGRAGTAVRSPYSIASAPALALDGEIELLVSADSTLGETGGDPLQAVGALLEIHGPLGAFGVPAASGGSPLVLVAGGTGIAPLRSVTLDVLAQQPGRAVSVIYSARSADEFAFDDEFQALAAHGRISLLKTVTRDEPAQWRGRTGRIDAHLLTSCIPEEHAWWLVCGPAAFVTEVRASLGRIGVDDSRIVVER